MATITGHNRRTERLRRVAPLAVVFASLAVGSLGAGVALAKASHAGWPKINGKLLIESGPAGESHVLRGLPNKHNELLGGYGNDTIYGGNVGDVIWGDYHGSGQPTNQVDTIHAGNGPNFIYTSHGTNYVWTGGGKTIVHAHFGRGVIHCGSSQVVVQLSHESQPLYHLVGCKHLTFD